MAERRMSTAPPAAAGEAAPKSGVTDRPASRRSLIAAAGVLGVSMSGFFDGILLHQVLQWHHLLSLVPGEPFEDPRVQVYADGMFHVLMYGLMMIGLWFLWRERLAMSRPGMGRAFLVAFIAGFGAWNVADVALFHWVLRLHSIRLDTSAPFAWDVGWLLGLGLAPLGVAALLRRRARGPSRPPIVASVLAGSTLAAGTLNLYGGPPSGEVAVLFRPGLTQTERMTAVADIGGRLVATDRSGELIVMRVDVGAPVWALYGDGALMVGRTAGGGCLNATRTPGRQVS